MPPINPQAAKAVNEALLTNANIERLRDVLTAFAAGLIKQAQQEGTAKTSGLRARLEAEHEALILVEEIFRIDTSDTCEEIADECLAETGYDLRKGSYPAEDAAEFADRLVAWARDAQLTDSWGRVL